MSLRRCTEALESGCIPIYYGAPNVDDYIPDAAGIINYAKLGPPCSSGGGAGAPGS